MFTIRFAITYDLWADFDNYFVKAKDGGVPYRNGRGYKVTVFFFFFFSSFFLCFLHFFFFFSFFVGLCVTKEKSLSDEHKPLVISHLGKKNGKGGSIFPPIHWVVQKEEKGKKRGGGVVMVPRLACEDTKTLIVQKKQGEKKKKRKTRCASERATPSKNQIKKRLKFWQELHFIHLFFCFF